MQINQNRIFVAITDEIIYSHPEQIESPLIPYTAGIECQHWLHVELNPDDTNQNNSTLLSAA